MSRRLSKLERQIGPRPEMTLVIDGLMIREIWVEGRAPIITIHNYDWGQTDPDPAIDPDGYPYSPINWRGPAWSLGLSLHPPEKETYTMANQKMKSIPLADLKVSKLNMRHGRKHPDIADILPSIREHGLRQSLLVRPEGKHYGVVAGRRRLFALKKLAKESGIEPRVPCIVMRDNDDAEAIEASLIENIARLPATEMEQYTAFNRLHEAGRNVEEIADYYGVTALTVRRVLALAQLIEPIRTLYADGEIDRDTIRALTLANEAQQAEWMALYESKTERAPMGQRCKAWVTGGSTITTDKALFDAESFDGTVLSDLFGEQGVFADTAEFWKHQSAAIAQRVEAYTQKGWTDIRVLERGEYFASWEYRNCPRTKGGMVFVEIRHDGEVKFHEGFITAAEAHRREKKTKARKGETPVKPEMSGPMASYILRHRHAAARAELLGAPAIALRLMVAHALVGSALWDVRPMPKSVRKAATAESLANAPATANFAKAGENIARLFAALETKLPTRNGDAYSLCRTFSALLAMSDDDVMSVLTFAMASTLEAGGPMVEALLHVLGVDLTTHWKPDAAFFDLLRDKRVINAMLSDVGSASLADSMLTDTGKVQKEAMQNRIKGEGCKPNADWRPGWMQIPARPVLDGASSPPADQWARVAALFEERQSDGGSVSNVMAHKKAA